MTFPRGIILPGDALPDKGAGFPNRLWTERGSGRARCNILTAIDVGASKVCAAVFPFGKEPSGLAVIPIAGWPEHPSTEPGLAVLIERAVSEADAMAGHKTSQVWFSLSGNSVRYRLVRGLVQTAATDRLVSRSDLERAIAAAVPGRAKVLHQLLISTILDGREILEDPTGQAGERLEVNIQLVEAEGGQPALLQRMAAHAHLKTEGFVAGSLATVSVLTPAEREIGTAVLDLGATHTTAAVCLRGRVRHLGGIGLGSLHLAKDLAVVLGLPLAKAERIKREVLAPDTDQDQLAAPAGRVIAARLGETLELIRAELDTAGWAGRLPGGYVLTGGGAPPESLFDLAREALGAPVRLGLPSLGPSQGLLAGPAYAVLLGLHAVVHAADFVAKDGFMPKGGSRWRSWFPQRRLPI